VATGGHVRPFGVFANNERQRPQRPVRGNGVLSELSAPRNGTRVEGGGERGAAHELALHGLGSYLRPLARRGLAFGRWPRLGLFGVPAGPRMLRRVVVNRVPWVIGRKGTDHQGVPPSTIEELPPEPEPLPEPPGTIWAPM